MRRLAGNRLERLGKRWLDLVVDTYRRAVAERPFVLMAEGATVSLGRLTGSMLQR